MWDRNQNKPVENEASKRLMSKHDIQKQRKLNWVDLMDTEDTAPEPGQSEDNVRYQ